VEPLNATLANTIEAAELIVAYLDKIGVKHVFGVPGGAIEPIYNALARSERRGGVRSVVSRHETGAAFMADGYARETGRLGVCIATAGPGATNLITGVACAYANGVPMLVITGQPPIHSFGKGALQEGSCTGINAVMQARQTRGPAHLSIPVDILRSAVKAPAPASDPGFSELASSGWCASLMNSRLVHIDSNEENLMRSPMARPHVRGRILSVCAHLLERMQRDPASNVYELPDPGRGAGNPHVTLQAPEQFDADTTPIKPQRLMKELSRRCPPSTRFLADTGNSMIWASRAMWSSRRPSSKRSTSARSSRTRARPCSTCASTAKRFRP